MKPIDNKWLKIEKAFDEKFSSEWWKGFGTTDDIDKKGITGIKSFLKTIYTQAYKEGRGEYREELVEEIEELKTRFDELNTKNSLLSNGRDLLLQGTASVSTLNDVLALLNNSK